jgi:nucleoside-diphosphate-sugar epimerase
VADAIALALRQPGAIGRAYTLVDHEVPMRDYLRLYRSIAGARWRPIHVPARLPLAVIPPASFAFRLLRRRFPVSAHQIERATWSAHFDCTRARTELGWTPRVPLAVAMRVALEAADGATAQAPAEKPDGLSYEAHRSAG